jgi:hypothetical protein
MRGITLISSLEQNNIKEVGHESKLQSPVCSHDSNGCPFLVRQFPQASFLPAVSPHPKWLESSAMLVTVARNKAEHEKVDGRAKQELFLFRIFSVHSVKLFSKIEARLLCAVWIVSMLIEQRCKFKDIVIFNSFFVIYFL